MEARLEVSLTPERQRTRGSALLELKTIDETKREIFFQIRKSLREWHSKNNNFIRRLLRNEHQTIAHNMCVFIERSTLSVAQFNHYRKYISGMSDEVKKYVDQRSLKLWEKYASLYDREVELKQLLPPASDVLQGALMHARQWHSELETAATQRRRERDSLVELRAAAAKNVDEHRQMADSVKRKLGRQPWCPYCGGALGEDPHADHIYPIAKGGRSVPKNMVYACSPCNVAKRALTLTAFIRQFSLDRGAIEDRLTQLGKDF